MTEKLPVETNQHPFPNANSQDEPIIEPRQHIDIENHAKHNNIESLPSETKTPTDHQESIRLNDSSNAKEPASPLPLEIKVPLDDFVDEGPGSLRALIGAWCMSFTTFGLLNSFGTINVIHLFTS